MIEDAYLVLGELFEHFLNEDGLTDNGKHKVCDKIMKTLNNIFPKFKCTEVIYTENTDHEFFGARIYPFLGGTFGFIDPIMNSDREIEPFTRYQLEIDSKLFSGMVPFYRSEITALILRDINAYTSTNCFNEFIYALNGILAKEDQTFDRNAMEKNRQLFRFVFLEFLRYTTSVFCTCCYNELTYDEPDFLLDDDNSDMYIYYTSGIQKIKQLNPEFNGENPSIFTSGRYAYLLLQWYLKVYKTIDKDRYTLILLKKSVSYSGSELFKRIVFDIISGLEKASWNGKGMDEMVSESATKKGFFSQMKANGMKSIEDDLYEFKMRIRNVDTQDDALLLMRQINNRMAIVDEYLMDESLSDKERERWMVVYEKYQKLREELSDKKVYNRKMYGLYVDYNTLQQMNDNSALLNTYY